MSFKLELPGPELHSRVLPGVTDVAAASLAAFCAGLFAVRYFDARVLGVYAMFSAAMQLAVVVPTQLVFLPAEIRLLAVKAPHRNQGFRLTFWLGVPVAFAAGSVVLLAWLPTASSTSVPEAVPLAVTAWAAAWLTPVQAHVRKLQHLAGTSWIAATMSTVQLLAVAGTIGLAVATHINQLWIPFGALAVGCLVSLPVGLLAPQHSHTALNGLDLRWKQLIPTGRWLLARGALTAGSNFAAGSVVVLLAGSKVMGFAEAARIAARPLLVFAQGLDAVIGPRAMEAGSARDAKSGTRLARFASILVAGVGGLTLLLLGTPWLGNPLKGLIGNAYEVPGLVAVTIVANIGMGMLISERGQLLGGGKEVALTFIEGIGSAMLVLVALTAAFTRSFAIPLGVLTLALCRWRGYRSAVRRLYGGPRPARRRMARVPAPKGPARS